MKLETLALWERFSAMPGGRWLFSRLICFKVPYFATLRPSIRVLQSGRCEVHVKKHRGVLNHIGTVLGVVGFWYPNDWPEPEIKWGFAARYWRKGFASEAVRVVQAAARERLPDLRLISLIHEDNAAFIGLARAVGATFERATTYGDWPCHIYRHPR